jgi:putative hydrolase of the HAD superfamily
VLGSAHALLDSLRTRGIKTGVVANSWPDPARLLRQDVEAYGLADLLDVIVFSDEVGVQKPEPAIFLHALGQLAVDPTAAMFVGDRLTTDVQGAAAVGMTTVQALWFRADDTPGIEPDFMAFTPMDVLNAVGRLAR